MQHILLEEQNFNMNEKKKLKQEQNEEVFDVDLEREGNFQLPRLNNINVDALISENTKLLDQELLEPIIDIHRKVYSRLLCYDPEELRNFKFKLPQSMLPPKRQIATFFSPLREDAHDEEDIYSANLSRPQLKDIWNTGIFHVKSKMYPQDYIFQLNSWVAKGRININKTLKLNVDQVFKELYKIKYRVLNEKAAGRFGCDISSSLKTLFSIPSEIVFLIFGSPWTQSKKNNDRSKELEESRVLKLLSDSNVDRELHKYIHEGSFIVLCTRWEREFLYDVWPNEKPELERQFLQEKSTYSRNIADAQNKQLIEHVSKQSFMMKDRFINYLKASVILMEKDYEFSTALQEKENELKVSIQKRHSFKSKFPQWFEKFKKTELEKYKRKLREKKNSEILTLLEGFPKEKYLFEKYLDYLKELPALREQDRRQSKREVKVGVQYKKIFTLKMEKISCSAKEDYTLVIFNPDHYFWKFSLLLRRINSTTRHVFVYFYSSAVFGHFGVKRLVNFEKFESPEAEKPRSPIWLQFKEVRNSIRLDREKFENSKDDGFMPKSCSRIANLVYNYLLKFLLIGVAYILIFQAALILFLCPLMFALAFTSFFWGPVAVITVRVGHILIFDPDTDSEGLVIIAYKLLVLFLLQLLLSIVGMVGHVVISILLLIFGLFRYILENIYYTLMMLPIICLGRVPGNDTSIAWKIQSPFKMAGFNFKYLKMELHDILYLVLSFVEKQELTRYTSLITNAIARPKLQITSFLEKVQKQLKMKLYEQEPKLLTDQVDQLRNRLSSEIQSRHSIFPNIEKFKNSIKMTSKELEHTQNSVALYLEDISATKDLDFLWFRASIPKGSYLNLANYCLENIFGKGIFTTIDSTEARTNVLVARTDEFFGVFSSTKKLPDSVMSIPNLKSELNLEHQGPDKISYPIFKLNKISETVPINEDAPYEFTIRLKIAN